MSVELLGSLPTLWRGRGGPRAATWGGAHGPPWHLPSWLCGLPGKIGAWQFVSSNSENISRLAFLEYKNSRKQELALRHLVNRLVPEKCIKVT